METGYIVKESKHTSLLEDGFIPVETAPEVPVQEQFIKRIIEKELKKYRQFQIILTLIQLITVIILLLEVIIK